MSRQVSGRRLGIVVWLVNNAISNALWKLVGKQCSIRRSPWWKLVWLNWSKWSIPFATTAAHQYRLVSACIYSIYARTMYWEDCSPVWALVQNASWKTMSAAAGPYAGTSWLYSGVYSATSAFSYSISSSVRRVFTSISDAGKFSNLRLYEYKPKRRIDKASSR